MIEFELTEDHLALVQTVREFAQKEIAPYIKEWDEKQEYHPEVLKKMGEINLLGVCIPEAYGGAGFDYISLGELMDAPARPWLSHLPTKKPRNLGHRAVL